MPNRELLSAVKLVGGLTLPVGSVQNVFFVDNGTEAGIYPDGYSFTLRLLIRALAYASCSY
ncbi:MAG: hypothetical protein ACRC46_02480 [Thermoguttaceae bacterium]